MQAEVIFKETSEWVLRNAAAWCFRDSNVPFEIRVCPQGLAIALTAPLSVELSAKLDRFINEFALREAIDQRTGQLREEIVKDSLTLVYRAKDGSAAD